MTFLLQDPTESNALSIEIAELKEELDEQRNGGDNYKIVPSSYFTRIANEFYDENTMEWMRNEVVPVGSIEFVRTYLREIHGIENINPIEIPECLRLPHLLLRDYRIVNYDDIPREGEYFVKDVSRLKGFSYQGSMRALFSQEFSKTDMDKTHLFQVSDILPIISEYRVVVIKNKIYGIQFYDGNPTVMPTPREIKKIQEAVVRYSMAKDCPGAYTMDVAVVDSEREEGRDLAIIEVHPSCSAGMYGCRGAFLPMMYKLGIRWYLEHNTPMRETK